MFAWLFGEMMSYRPFASPMSSSARFDNTSFMFMLTEVPAPPWIGSTGNWSRSFPSMISSAASTSALPMCLSRRPVSMFACAAAFFTFASDWMKSVSSFLPVMLKFSTARMVCTP